MNPKILILFFIIYLTPLSGVKGQVAKIQKGLILKSGTAARLGDVQVLNKRSHVALRSNTVGTFGIVALPGDTLQFSSANYLTGELVVTDFADKLIYLQPVIELAEVVIRENSLVKELRETQMGYRKKSVFYTGTPHYYYLFLKPMTFIYENFKSEVKQARRFNRFAKQELTVYEITKRFNDSLIKKVVPVKANEIDDFRVDYAPTLQRLNTMSDYDLINYIRDSYEDYKKKSADKRTPHQL
ncbi:hypothetical protein SAMN05421821_11226 [Mucilaginibacter lappiensis]|uniref:Carboxypeptidase-like regulatory domain-containing protein n=1 Tax=Mucilaginibacter lappiensis TaxID=354630 RepID=A0ABR6PQX0_9SPHI|nr:hypothetical protein [Mucilaginibacter lappiensis]MBB6111405.1 hypothetical protein [Mucilaginibacter lappiensis]SIR78589.1 hypothetical protein SAMN05421821_11226 [Mucilaginibacter lappiensis]